MISNFPTPYPDELIYSVIARYAIHHGIQSPKYLTEELFNNRNFTPSYDLPSYIDTLATYLPSKYDALTLINNHTLLAIYKPFQPNPVINYAIEAMQGNEYKNLHIKLGKNASRIKTIDYFRFCPHCWQEQIEKYGEIYWKRVWQITGYEYCTTHHQPLFISLTSCKGTDRKFYPADLHVLKEASQIVLNQQDLKRHHSLSMLIEALLSQDTEINLNNFSDISNSYFKILKDKNLLAGKKTIAYEQIKKLILKEWGINFLAYYQLSDLESNHCWLKNIFRKHRKAFSYLQHLIVLKALVPEQSAIETYKQYIALIDTEEERISNNIKKNQKFEILTIDQQQWLELIKINSVKHARQHDGALYARLYRNHKDWLLFINQSAVVIPVSPIKPLVDWVNRDRQFIKRLIQIRDNLLEELDSPHWSKKFFIRQLGCVSMIENNWHFLPLTTAFLERYAESVSCYQIRRLTRTYIQQHLENKVYPPSIFLRQSGLSPQRLTAESYKFLNNILEIKNE